MPDNTFVPYINLKPRHMHKKNYCLFTFLIVSCFLLTSACKDITTFIEPDPSLEVDVTELKFDAEGGTASFNVKAYNTDWKMTHEPANGSWTYETGDEGENNAVVKYSLATNESDTAYTDYFEISAPDCDPVIINIRQEGQVFTPSLAVYPDNLVFLSESSSDSFFVTPEHVDKWEVQTSDTWYTFEVADSPDDNGRYEVTVTVQENESTEDRYGELMIVSEDIEEPLTVSVTQFAPMSEPEEPENIWQRSYRSRMNFKGLVKNVTTHINFFTMAQIQDLDFDNNGMLTQFGVDYMGFGIRTIKVNYNADKQISSIDASWDGGGYFSVDFTYGSHGKYIPVWEFFQKMQEYSISLEHTAWLPRVICNLQKIEVTYHDSEETEGTISAVWNTEGDSSELTAEFDYSWGSDTYTQTITYSGEYPVSIHAGDGSLYDYEINPANGYMISYAEYYEGSDPNGYTIFNNDDINSIAGNNSTDSWSGFTAEYDENLNLTSCTYGDEFASFTVDYPSSDVFGNWLESTATWSYMTLEYSREITYFE